MPPKLNRKRAMLVLTKIDEILAWERQKDTERDTRFVELGRYLCEVRAGQYWRLENLKSFDEFLESFKHPKGVAQQSQEVVPATPRTCGALHTRFTDEDRISIKRRKVGKFIGLKGLDTPAEEIVMRIQFDLGRASRRREEELRRTEEAELRRQKMG